MERWQGRVALVTGASAGIGAATAKLLVKHGMKVVGCARTVERIQSMCDDPDIKSAPGQLIAMKCDLSKEDEILTMFRDIEKMLGGVDVCINNAGCGIHESLLLGSTEGWRQVVDLNIIALCICTRETVKSMRSRGVDDGHIINVSSLSGHRVGENPFYSASKFAVRALSEGMRRELREMKTKIRVSQLSPGYVRTEFESRAMDDATKGAEIYDKLGIQIPEPADMAATIAHMLTAPPHVEIHDILIRPTEQIS